jgi:hypothetical protein
MSSGKYVTYVLEKLTVSKPEFSSPGLFEEDR